MIVWRPVFLLAVLLLVFGTPCAVRAGEVNVAVAANFTAPMKAIAAAFERETGHTGQTRFRLFRQVLCADKKRRAFSDISFCRR